MRYLLCAVITVLVILTAIPSTAKKEHTPLDRRIIAAKSVYLESRADDKLTHEAYIELKNWRRWEIVSSRTLADLVLTISSEEQQSSTAGTQDGNSTGKAGPHKKEGPVRLELQDAKWGTSLYSAWGKSANELIQSLAKKIDSQESRTNAQGSSPSH